MSRFRFSGFQLAELIAWAAFAVCLRQLFGLFETGALDMLFLFNSDSLFLADLIQDLRNGGRLSDWNLTHAVYLLPDLAMWFLVALIAPSLQWTVILFGALQAFLAVWLTRALLVRQYGQPMGGLAPAAYCLVFAFIARGELTEALDIIKPIHHFGVALTALAAFWLLSDWLKTLRWSRLGLLAGMLGVGCFSDPFTLTCVAVPVVAVLAVAFMRSPIDKKKNLIASLLIVAAAFCGHLGAKMLTDVADEPGRVRLDGVAGQWAMLRTAVQTLEFSVPDVIAVLGVIAMPLLLIRGVVRMREPDLGATLDIAPAVATGANLGALLVTGNVVHVLFNRYQIVIFALLVLTLVRVAASIQSVWRSRIAAGIIAWSAILVALCAALSMTHKLWDLPRMSLTSWRPAATECLVKAALQHDARRGLGDFWNARLYSSLNAEGLRVEQVDGNGLPDRWLNTMRPYSMRTPPVAFALVSRLNTVSIEQTYGAPTTIVSCENEVVWFWDPPQREMATHALNALAPK